MGSKKASGIRTSKTVNGVKTEYLTAGGSILAEKKNGKWQQYLYDGSGQLMAIRYKGADYYYIRDGLMCITSLQIISTSTGGVDMASLCIRLISRRRSRASQQRFRVQPCTP